MDVSQFEIVFKPQSPVGAADTVLQGYFLEISNLEDVSYRYQLEFVTSSITDPDRQLAGNTVVLVDRPGSNNAETFALTGAPDGKSFRLNQLVTIPAHGTALVAMLPSDAFAVPATEQFETRGYVRLTLPPTFQFNPPFNFFFGPQSDAPVRVMLTPQNRAQYLAADGSGITDQTQASVPLASGAAVNEIPPGQVTFPIGLGALATDLNILSELAVSPERSASVLAGLMAQIEAADADLGEVNGVLEKAGVTLRLGRGGDASGGAKTSTSRRKTETA